MVTVGTFQPMPAPMALCRAGFWPAPACSTWPMITASTSAGVHAAGREGGLDGVGPEFDGGEARQLPVEPALRCARRCEDDNVSVVCGVAHGYLFRSVIDVGQGYREPWSPNYSNACGPCRCIPEQCSGSGGLGRSTHPRGVHDGGGLRRVGGGHFRTGTAGPLHTDTDTGSSIVKKILAAAAVAALAGLDRLLGFHSCPGGPLSADPAGARRGPALRPAGARRGAARPPSSSPGRRGQGSVRALQLPLRRATRRSRGDAEGVRGHLPGRPRTPRTLLPGTSEGLFASLSLLAIDHSAAAESGGEPEQASKDAVRDAVFANAGTCTAEGVTLTALAAR